MKKNMRLQLCIILYLLFIGSLMLLKPQYIYKKDGSLKNFGTGRNKTLFPLWFLIFIGAYLSYYLGHIVFYLINK